MVKDCSSYCNFPPIPRGWYSHGFTSRFERAAGSGVIEYYWQYRPRGTRRRRATKFRSCFISINEKTKRRKNKKKKKLIRWFPIQIRKEAARVKEKDENTRTTFDNPYRCTKPMVNRYFAQIINQFRNREEREREKKKIGEGGKKKERKIVLLHFGSGSFPENGSSLVNTILRCYDLDEFVPCLVSRTRGGDVSIQVVPKRALNYFILVKRLR